MGTEGCRAFTSVFKRQKKNLDDVFSCLVFKKQKQTYDELY